MLEAGSVGMTHYAVLGIPENADTDAIHNAYRARARQYHPDAGEGSSASKFREVAEAYETLSDPALRRAYDAMLTQQRTPHPQYVVEPLAQPGFSAWSSSFRPMQALVIDEWFEETLRAFDELFSAAWHSRW
jgi:curved DNA-binding protein CbpA